MVLEETKREATSCDESESELFHGRMLCVRDSLPKGNFVYLTNFTYESAWWQRGGGGRGWP